MGTSKKDGDSSPPPPDSSSDSNSNSPPPPPPPSDDSSTPSAPPPPSSDSSQSPPPPPPPPKSPPPPQKTKSPPPPPKNKSPSSPKSPPSPPPPPTPPPPPGSKNHRSFLPPPPPPLSSNDNTTSSSSESSSSTNIPMIVGVVIGSGVLLLILIAMLVACTRKKKQRRHESTQYYGDHFQSGNQGFSGQQAPWHSTPTNAAHHYSSATAHSSQNWGPLPPPPPPPMLSSTDMSTAGYSSGPHNQPPLPPPHPSVALGFNKSTFTYEELATATGGFSPEKLLGQGGFGLVHKGVLPNGKEIAVKSLKLGSGQGDREFQAEVEIISRVHHRHLVTLVGYCVAGGQRMLVYEFVPNKTLEFHLHGKGRPVMDFARRIKIALGSAKGLAYLHEDCHPKIIHRDIKAANILLDHSFEAKVADFGLAKLSSDNNTHVSTRVMGTFGYLAPEYASSGKLTEKSDVFSFGIMLLELITGRHPIDLAGDDDSLVDWARPLLSRTLEEGIFEGLVDARLENEFDAQEMMRLVACAAASIRHSGKRRSKMSQIVRALEGDVSLDDLNEGMKTSQSGLFSSSTSSDYEVAPYKSTVKRFRKMEPNSQECTSSEYGATNDYGHVSRSSSEFKSEGTVNSPAASKF